MLNTGLRLSSEEQALLAGAQGRGVQRAMEMIVALARIYGARNLVSVDSAQVSGVSYANLGDAGLDFLQQWAEESARARIPAMLNPAGMDLLAWQEMGIPDDFAVKQQAVVAAYQRMGVTPVCTCAPYLFQAAPEYGSHLAWGESSAVAYANSVAGARTNREGGPGALAAAIVGRTGNYGLHLDEARQPTQSFLVQSLLHNEADWGALGAIIGKACQSVPYLTLTESAMPVLPSETQLQDNLRAFGAAAAATGSVALFHIVNCTAEAKLGAVTPPPGQPILIESLEPGYHSLNGKVTKIDLVAIGCPHASLRQLGLVAFYLGGKHVTIPLWLMVSRTVALQAQQSGLAEKLAASGARLVADTCVVVAPMRQLGITAIATNSAKAATYLPGHQGVRVRFASLEQCLDAALKGRFHD